LIERTGRAEMPGLMIAAVALCVLPVFLWMRETAPGKDGRVVNRS
jgi:MHS family proline/betaine transporter-like MFS transporter